MLRALVLKTTSKNLIDNVLAISAILQGENTVGQLSELLSKIITDVEADGALNNTTYTAEITANSVALSLSEVRTNLQDRYYSLVLDDLATNMPKFEDYVDSDGDGTINKNDAEDTYIWVKAVSFAPTADNAAPWTERRDHSMVVYDNKLWIMGGINTSNTNLNDVWYSADGITWTQMGDTAHWTTSTRQTFPAVSTSFDGTEKIWVVGGYNSVATTTLKDVWYYVNYTSYTP